MAMTIVPWRVRCRGAPSCGKPTLPHILFFSAKTLARTIAAYTDLSAWSGLLTLKSSVERNEPTISVSSTPSLD